MSMASRLRPFYLRGRAAIRAAITRNPTIDRLVGRRLVHLDLLFRRVTGFTPVDAAVREFTLDGLRFRFDDDNRDLAETILTTGTYEPATLEVVRALPPGATFVDLGANLGLYTVLAARAVGPTGRVYAFEPTPATAALLRANVDANGVAAQVTIVPSAVSDHTGTARFSVFRGAGQANQLELANTPTHDTIEVPVTSLDAYLSSSTRVDLVKMDIEGAELPALHGMRATIARNPDLRLIFEYNLNQLSSASIPGPALLDAVRSLGFDRFATLFRTLLPLTLPADLPTLTRLATRANLNILAWRTRA